MGLCPEGGVSVERVSLSKGVSLSMGVSVQGGLCQGDFLPFCEQNDTQV